MSRVSQGPGREPGAVRARSLDRIRALGVDSAWMAGSRALVILSSVVVAPVVVSQLGAATFGVWTVVLAAAGLFGVLGSGSEQVVARVIARLRVRGEDTRRPALIAVSLAAAEASVLALALGLLAPAIVGGTGASGSLEADSVEAMRWVAASYIFQRAGRVAVGCLSGLGRHRARSLFEVVPPLAFAISGTAVLLGGGGLIALSVMLLLANVAGAAVTVIALRDAPGGTRVEPRAITLELWRLGRPRQVSQVVFVVALLAERVLVSQFAGEITTGRYAAASTLVGAATVVLLYALNPLGPELAARSAAEGPAAVRTALRDAQRGAALLAGACFGALAACAVPLTTAWLGPELQAGHYVAVLAPGFFVWLIARAGFHAAAALEEPWLEARAAVPAGVLNVVAAIALLEAFGPGAAGIATAISLIGWAVLFTRSSQTLLETPPLRELLAPGAIAAVIAAPLAVGGDLILGPDQGSRWAQLAMATALALAFLGLYALATSRWERLSRTPRS